MKPHTPMTPRSASHSMLVGMTSLVFVARILRCRVSKPSVRKSGKAHNVVDVITLCREKEDSECSGCARLPMARIVMSEGPSALYPLGDSTREATHKHQ